VIFLVIELLTLKWLTNWLRGILISVIVFTLATGCAHRATSSLTPTVIETFALPSYIELTSVPFFPQEDESYQCGSTSLATVLNYRGIPVSPETLVPRLFIPEKRGSLAVELVSQARHEGALVYPLQAPLAVLFKEVAAGHPILVLQNLSFAWLPQWHFAVVVGYDLNSSNIILRSGNTRRHLMPIELFEKTWRRGEHWAMIVTHPTKLPASADPFTYLSAAADLEKVGQTAVAKEAYQKAADTWSSISSTAYLGLANIAYQEAQLLDAKKWLLSAIAQDEDNALVWNNLAYIMFDLGCPIESKNSIICASTIDPSNAIIGDSKAEIFASFTSLGSNQSSKKTCDIPTCPQPAVPSL
jgi:tetratricopeptide (TPR) repeat protein